MSVVTIKEITIKAIANTNNKVYAGQTVDKGDSEL